MPSGQFSLKAFLWFTSFRCVTVALTTIAAADEKPATRAFQPGSDWPMYRHDPALSAESPMVGGLATSAFLTLEVLPVLYTIWRYRQLRQAQRIGSTIGIAVGALPAPPTAAYTA